jgi:hypothetical protein
MYEHDFHNKVEQFKAHQRTLDDDVKHTTAIADGHVFHESTNGQSEVYDTYNPEDAIVTMEDLKALPGSDIEGWSVSKRDPERWMANRPHQSRGGSQISFQKQDESGDQTGGVGGRANSRVRDGDAGSAGSDCSSRPRTPFPREVTIRKDPHEDVDRVIYGKQGKGGKKTGAVKGFFKKIFGKR